MQPAAKIESIDLSLSFHQSRKLAISVAKFLSRSQLRCFPAALATGMGMQSSSAFAEPAVVTGVAPAMASSAAIGKNLWGLSSSSSARSVVTLTGSHSRVKIGMKMMLLQGPGLNRAAVQGARTACTMITEGAKLPDANLSYFDKEGNVHTVKVSDLTRAKKVRCPCGPFGRFPMGRQK